MSDAGNLVIGKAEKIKYLKEWLGSDNLEKSPNGPNDQNEIRSSPNLKILVLQLQIQSCCGDHMSIDHKDQR